MIDATQEEITKEKDIALPRKKFTFARKTQPQKQNNKETDKKEENKIDGQQNTLISNNALDNHLSIKNIYN